jgi:hypothetical protein
MFRPSLVSSTNKRFFMKISDCCGTEMTEPIMQDYGICPDCQDHCEWVDYDSDDDLIYNNWCHEGGIKH